MKKLFFTAILLIILCTTWMLYLNYSHKRFIDDIGIPPMPSTKSINTSDTLTASNDEETVHVDVTPSETVSTTDTHTKAELVEKHPQNASVEEVRESFEKRLTEVDGSQTTKTKDTFEDFLESHLETFLESEGITKEEYEEKKEIAQEVMQRLNNVDVVLLRQNEDGSWSLIGNEGENLGVIGVTSQVDPTWIELTVK